MDQDVSGLRPHDRARAGLGRTWQAADLFDDLTVRENLRVAAGRPSARGTLWELTHGRQHQVDGVDTRAGRAGDRGPGRPRRGPADPGPAQAGRGGPRAGRAPARLLCLDEPAAGLDTEESRDLGLRLRRVVDAGTAMLLVDHDMGLVLSVCDHVIVLDFGKVIARGAPSEVRQDHAVIKAYLGGAAGAVEAGR